MGLKKPRGRAGGIKLVEGKRKRKGGSESQ